MVQLQRQREYYFICANINMAGITYPKLIKVVNFMYVLRLKNIISVCCLSVILCIGWIVLFRVFFESKNAMSGRYSTYTVVVDAGHGGMDGGATGTTYGTLEKEINLAVAEKTYLLLNLFGVPCVMTRTDDISLNYNPEKTTAKNKSADLFARLEITNSQPSPLFLSIHMNKFEQSQYKGAQTFFSPNHEASQSLAEAIQGKMIETLDSSNTRVAKKSDGSIFLLKNLKCPAVIVECGFLSNPYEEKKLNDEEYRKKISYAIVYGYLSFLLSDKV